MNTEKQEAIIYARVPYALRGALERERKRMSKVAGAEVKTSAVIRAILEQALRAKRRPVERAA
jgi:predicted site-specific integrase-resolvase